MLTRGLVVLWTAALAACSVSLEIDSDPRIACSDNGDCPRAWRCEVDLGFCLPNRSNDNTAPEVLASPTVRPPVVGVDQEITVGFDVSEPLLTAPVVALRIGAVTVQLEGVALDEDSYAFTYRTDGSEPEGTALITASLVDMSGNASTTITLGSVAVDFSPPIINDVILHDTLLVGDEHWFDRVGLSMTLDVTDAPAGLATVEVQGDVVSAGSSPFVSPLALTLTAGDELKVVSLRFADQVGNWSETVTRRVQLDASIPSNRVIIDAPDPTQEHWVKQTSWVVFFHSDGPLPQDFDHYAVSTDGSLWLDAGANGFFRIDPLAMDATTTVWIEEVDLFGNTTPDDRRGELVIHQDSQPPSSPELAVSVLAGTFSCRAGVLLSTASTDPGGGPVTYEVYGGAHAAFEPVGDKPWIPLDGVAFAKPSLFVIRAVDRAGNASDGVAVQTVNDPTVSAGALGCTDFPCTTNNGFVARHGHGLFRQTINANSAQVLYVCSAPYGGALRCGNVHYDATLQHDSYDAFGRHVVFQLEATGVLYYDIGTDGYVGGDDDDGPQLVRADAWAPAGVGNAFVYAGSGDKLYYYGLGVDQRFGTADTGEGEVELTFAAVVAQPSSPRDRPLDFNGRHLVWRSDGTDDVYFVDLGADRLPNTADDVAPQLLTSQGVALLEPNGIYADGRLTLFGADESLGTEDDTSIDVPGITSITGDKAVVGEVGETETVALVDLSTSEELTLPIGPSGWPIISPVYVADGRVFFGMNSAEVVGPVPGTLRLYAGAPRYGYASEASLTSPGGVLAGDLAFTSRFGAFNTERFFNLELGGAWRPSADWAISNSGLEVDIDGRRIVYRDDQGRIMLVDVGADMIPGSADDMGPVEVAAAPARGPRISGHLIVWSDVTGDGDGSWTGADLVSQIEGLDLGADGWLGGGDDTRVTVSSGTRAIYPDVSGDRVVWLDLESTCEVWDDPPPCMGTIHSRVMGNAEEDLVSSSRARLGLRIDEGRTAWLEWVDALASWEVMVTPIGGSPQQISSTGGRKFHLALDGNRVGIFDECKPLVYETGADGVFGGDEIPRVLDSTRAPRFCGVDLEGPSLGWLSGETVLVDGAIIDLSTQTDTFTSGSLDLTIPDDAAQGVTSELDIDVPPWIRVHEMQVSVSLTHPEPAELRIVLISPSGDDAVLFDRQETGLPDVFTLDNAPGLFDHFHESLVGTWQLVVIDTSAAAGVGTLTGWTIWHRY